MSKCIALFFSAAALCSFSPAVGAPMDHADTCTYRQAGVSVPAIQVSSSEVGHPWRATYGYCLLGGERFVLHQDWVLSYLDAKPVGGFPGGDGVGLGTDLLLRWHRDWQPSILPYLETGVGLQFAAGTAFPADGSRWMFTLQAGAGWLIPMQRERQANVALRYLHISNAGVGGRNSGYDVVHLVLGLRWGRSR